MNILWGGAFFAPFVHVDRGGGYVECPRLSTRGGEGVKIGSKLVHVVVEWPLSYDEVLILMTVSPTVKCILKNNEISKLFWKKKSGATPKLHSTLQKSFKPQKKKHKNYLSSTYYPTKYKSTFRQSSLFVLLFIRTLNRGRRRVWKSVWGKK